MQGINNCRISFNKFSEFLPVFTCASAIGTLCSICLDVSILSLELLVFNMPDTVNFVKNILLLKPLKTISLALKKPCKIFITIFLSRFLSTFFGLVFLINSLIS